MAKRAPTRNKSEPAASRGRQIPNTKQIKLYTHCRRCITECPEGVSPREWAELEVGMTSRGFQVWCRRHDINVMHIDFEGARHPANTRPAVPDINGD